MDPRGSDLSGPEPGAEATRRGLSSLGALRSDAMARWLFIWPAVLVILAALDLPARRVAGPVGLEPGLQAGFHRDRLRGPRQLLGAALRHRAEDLPGAAQDPHPAGLAAHHRQHRALGLVVPAIRPGRPAGPLRAGRPAGGVLHPGGLRVAAGADAAGRGWPTRCAHRDHDLRGRRHRRCSTRWACSWRCWRCGGCPVGASSGSCSSSP